MHTGLFLDKLSNYANPSDLFGLLADGRGGMQRLTVAFSPSMISKVSLGGEILGANVAMQLDWRNLFSRLSFGSTTWDLRCWDCDGCGLVQHYLKRSVLGHC